MKFKCENLDCDNTQEVKNASNLNSFARAFDELEDRYGWGWRGYDLLCHECLCHKQ